MEQPIQDYDYETECYIFEFEGGLISILMDIDTPSSTPTTGSSSSSESASPLYSPLSASSDSVLHVPAPTRHGVYNEYGNTQMDIEDLVKKKIKIRIPPFKRPRRQIEKEREENKSKEKNLPKQEKQDTDKPILEGSFNPYGNGQTLSKEQFLKKHKKRYGGLSKAEKDKRYNDYLSIAEVSSRNRKLFNEAFKTGKTIVDVTSAKAPRYSIQPLGPRGLDNGINHGAPRPRMGTEKSIGLSPCANYYLMALTDPWDIPGPPCVPDQITVPSYKFGARARGTFSTSILGDPNGFGYIAVNPYSPWSDTAAYNAIFTGSACTAANYQTTGTGIASAKTNSPFTYADFTVSGGTALNFRVVGCGLAIRYIGSQYQLSGQVVEYRHPANYDIPIGSTTTTLLQDLETTPVPVSREWHYVIWRPAVTGDLSYNAGTSTNNTMGIFVENTQVPLSFEFDIIQWYEVTGDYVTQLTVSESDPVGLAMVQNVISAVQPSGTPLQTYKQAVSQIDSTASEAMSFFTGLAKGFSDVFMPLSSIFL